MSENLHLEKHVEGQTLLIELTGRLDTDTAPLLENGIQDWSEGITQLILDFSEVDYLSSAGLRVLLAAHKRMMKQDGLVLRNVRGMVMEVLEMTGFSDVLTVE